MHKLLIISHRGNLTGSYPKLENYPDQIKKVLDLGIDCEVDIRLIDNKFYLGHDTPQYECPKELLENNNIWYHCKNLQSLYVLKETCCKVFWHENDQYTLTTNGLIWTCDWFNNNEECILMCANPKFKKLPNVYGLCTDYSLFYNKQYKL